MKQPCRNPAELEIYLTERYGSEHNILNLTDRVERTSAEYPWRAFYPAMTTRDFDQYAKPAA